VEDSLDREGGLIARGLVTVKNACLSSATPKGLIKLVAGSAHTKLHMRGVLTGVDLLPRQSFNGLIPTLHKLTFQRLYASNERDSQ